MLNVPFLLLEADNPLIDEVRLRRLLSCLAVHEGVLCISDPQVLRIEIEQLARVAAFGGSDAAREAHHLAWEIASQSGIYAASIDSIYRMIGTGDIAQKATVAALNMRAIAFHSARGVFQAMRQSRSGLVIFELSRGEIGFTGQRPQEYATAVLCAAVAEEHSGPVFLQGDHFQVSASRYAQDPESELKEVEALIEEAIAAGFYNIDIDTSTLVDLAFDKVSDQQALNASLTAHLATFTRKLQPEGVSISLGGEIGEVGEHNSTVAEVNAYLRGVSDAMPATCRGLSKLSVQTGTRHGGNVLADGTFGDMPIDFDLIRALTKTCREGHQIAGCVQHGASMLSLEKTAQLPGAGCIEVHLAAAFLNVVYACLPTSIVATADHWLEAKFAHEWREGWSKAQFLHHARRYPIGPFKTTWWGQQECFGNVREQVSELAQCYFKALGVQETRELVHGNVGHGPVAWRSAKQSTFATKDEASIRDLAD